MEAMACGLPVVCENRGGYAELIDHRDNGFLFDDTEEAVKIVEELIRDKKLCRRIGEQAREKMKRIYMGKQLERKVKYYLEAKTVATKKIVF
jgi:glycosyltransferase involved in cell wall biosynthesis